jgi:hypothetical protein
MSPVRAISYPSIWVYPDGKCVEDGENFLTITFNQGLTDGPSVYYRMPNGKNRYLAVKTLVIECFVLKRKMKKGERVLSIDGNSRNTHYTNLEIDTGKRTRDSASENECYGWMNGSSDIYL